MKLDGWEGWEHKIRDSFCTLCGSLIHDYGFRGCEESDHGDFRKRGYNFCPFCSKQVAYKLKFPGVVIRTRSCKECGNKIAVDHV